jgi:hypothetical protein
LDALLAFWLGVAAVPAVPAVPVLAKWGRGL